MLSERIHELREHHGLTQAQLAQRLGIPQETVRRWESGEALPAREHLAALSQCLHVTPEELTHPARPLLSPEERQQRHAAHRAAERKSGVTLCFAGAICMVLLLAELLLLPEAGQQLRLSSAAEVEGSILLLLISVLSMVTGLVIVLRNQ